jgi:hypothetical protein
MASCRRFDSALASQDTKELTFHLMNDKFYLPDIYRDYARMLGKYQQVMAECRQPFSLVNGDNKLGGVFFMSDIVLNHEGVFYCWIWDKSCYTPTTARFMGEYITHFAEECLLGRVVCRTPDDKGLGRMLERLGFKLEGRFARGFRHGGKSWTMFQYRILG